MNTTREGFKEELCRATCLLCELVAGGVSVADFIIKYDNFYYRYGLAPEDAFDDSFDGLLVEYEPVIALHRRVQDEVIGRLFIATEGVSDTTFLATGRLPVTAVIAAIRKIAIECDIEKLKMAVCA